MCLNLSIMFEMTQHISLLFIYFWFNFLCVARVLQPDTSGEAGPE